MSATSIFAAPRLRLGSLLGKGSFARSGISSVGWSTMAQLLCLFIRLGSNLLLTRMLAPQIYGILGTAMAVVTTMEWLSDLGIQPALIRHSRGEQKSVLLTGWWMGLGRASMISLLGLILAMPLSAFYQQPEIVAVLAVLSARPFLYALRSPAMPLLRRQLRYKAFFIEEVIQTVMGTIFSLVLAYYYRNEWAIVGGTIAGTLTAVIVSYCVAPFALSWNWDRAASKEIVRLGGQILANTLIMAVWLNMDRILGLSLVSTAEMGLYVVAFNLSVILETLLTRAFDVHFSMLAKLQTKEAQWDWQQKIQRTVLRVGMPCLAIAIALAPVAVFVLYDPRYAGAGILLAILGGRVMIRGLGQFQFQFLLVRGEIRCTTGGYLFAVAVQGLLLVILGPMFGVMGLASATVCSTLVVTLCQTCYLAYQYKYSFYDLVATCLLMLIGIFSAWSLYTFLLAN